MAHGFSPGGTIDDRYRLEGVLGRGAMGVVYLARDLKLDRQVAVKFLSSSLVGSAEFTARFHNEVETLASFDSPHILSILDVGEYDGTPYAVTAYVRGGDLAQSLRDNGALEVGTAVEICAQLAEALSDAHAHNVLHRDVKPSNVLIRDAHAATPFVYLADFGIAKTGSVDLTHTGGVAGTWAYLAPERGEGMPATPASDIYSLGCVLWACLTGASPYSGTDVQVAVQHMTAPIPQFEPTSTEWVWLNQILNQSMAKEPAQRFHSAQEMARALRNRTAVDPGEWPTILRPAGAAAVPQSDVATVLGGRVRGLAASGTVPMAAPAPSRRPRRLAAGLVSGALLLVAALVAGVLVLGADREDRSAQTGGDSVVEPTGAANPTKSSAGPRAVSDPLKLGAELENLPCNGKYVVFLGTTGLPSEYESKLGRMIQANPDARYLRNRGSCRALRRSFQGRDIYEVYLGPFETMLEACRSRAGLTSESWDPNIPWVRALRPGSRTRELCVCTEDARSLPVLAPTQGRNESLAMRRVVSDLEYILGSVGLNPESRFSGFYAPAVVDMVRNYQSVRRLAATGVTDAATWAWLQRDYC